MKNVLVNVIVIAVVVAGVFMGLSSGFTLDPVQQSTLRTLCIICACSMVYCFVVGEITLNNSQMDKLWSILPIIYCWVVAIKGGMGLRLVVMALLVTFWGARLTYNFACKGAYSIRFWSGEEDYRWVFLRKQPIIGNRLVWAVFDLFFISFYQNALVLAICFPAVACMSSTASFGLMDVVATLLVLASIVYETIADRQQMDFQTTKWNMIKQGKKLSELPAPYNKGFNTTGLWARSRHPNYFAEQSTWVCFYLFCIGAGVVVNGIFNWTICGCLLLVFLFMGSSMLGESLTSSKYPEYKNYQKQVGKYLPLRKYQG